MTDNDDCPRYYSAPFWLTRTRPCANFDIRGHVWVERFHCFAHCKCTMRRVRCKKKDLSVRIFCHTSTWLCADSSIISHWFTQCDVSLQNCINCETWRRARFHQKDASLHYFDWRGGPCVTFDIRGHVWVESFHCFAHCERTMRCVQCKTTCVYITFRLTKTCICVTINISHNVFHLPSHRYTWILIQPRDFFTYKSFSMSHY